MRWKRLAIWSAVALALAVLVWLALRPTPIAVAVGEVTRGPFETTVDEDGKTRVRDRFVVSAPVAGQLQRIELDPGDRVETGDLVGALQPAPATPLDPRTTAELRQRLRAAEASERSARAASAFAQSELARRQQLARTGAVARRDLEQAELQAEAAERQVQEAGALANALRAQLGVGGRSTGGREIELRAPAAGSVLRVLQESEAVVPAGTPILEIGNAAGLEVVTDVLSEEAVGIAQGAPARIDRWGGDRALQGRVRRVEPSAYTKVSALGVEEQRVDVLIDLLDPPEVYAGLGDGFRVVSRIVVYSVDDVITAPLGALFRSGDGWGVFVVDGDTARERQVKVGPRGDERAQILDGLASGEEVVLYPGDRLRDGSLIERGVTAR